MGLRELKPGSPEARRRDKLLAIMRNPRRPQEERLKAAVEALPLCHTIPDPIIVHTFRGNPTAEIQALARGYTDLALKALAEVSENASSEDVSAEAAHELDLRRRQIRRSRAPSKERP